MNFYIVEVVAVEAFRGNPNDPLIWHFRVEAGSPYEALCNLRRGPHGHMRMRVVPGI
jgi:hypothetical protein